MLQKLDGIPYTPKPGTTTTCGAKKGCFAVLGLMLVSSGLDNPSTGQPSTLIVIKRKYLHISQMTILQMLQKTLRRLERNFDHPLLYGKLIPNTNPPSTLDAVLAPL